MKEPCGKVSAGLHILHFYLDSACLTNVGKSIVEGVDGSLEKHRIELSNKLKSHYYDMCNQLSRNEGMWISGKFWTYIMWFSIACYAYTFISLSIMFALAFGK